jgi:prepilin-type N-terminal cleavage/methylation domain-containing protein
MFISDYQTTDDRNAARRAAFTLVELLVVMAVVALLMALAIPAFNSIGRAGDITKAGADIAGILEHARTHAMASNTRVWVGFSNSGNELLVGAVAARDGKSLPLVTDVEAANSGILPLGRVQKFKNLNLVRVPDDSGQRPMVPQSAQLAEADSPPLSFTMRSGGSPIVFDTHVITFNSRGESRMSSDNVQRLIEIGLQSVVDGTVRDSANHVAIQIGGLSGSVRIYRP